jgi:hypothetical protein
VPLDPPPRDDRDVVLPHDHTGILADDGIIRRIFDQQFIDDPKCGVRRLSSMVFKPSSGPNGGMSVDLQRSIEEAGLDARGYVTTPRWTGSVRFTAGALRAEAFQVGFDPLPDNPHHGEVWGAFSRARQRRLAVACVWFVAMDDVVIA